MAAHLVARVVTTGLLSLAAISLGCGDTFSLPTAPSAPLPQESSPPRVFSVTASATVVTTGEQLRVSWVAPSGQGCSGGGDWIAIFKVGDPDRTGAANGHSNLWYDHVCGATSGTFTLSAPSEPAEYEFRYMVGDRSVARSDPVKVIATNVP